MPVLLLVNLCPAVLGVLCFRSGYVSYMLVIWLTPVSICLNFRLTAGIKKMMLWNALFMAVSGAALVISAYLYQKKVAADTEGVLVAETFFAMWLVAAVLFVLGMLSCSLWMRRRKKQALVATGFFIVLFAGVALQIYLSIVPAVYEYSYVMIYNDREIDYNEKYEGLIGYDSITIRSREDGTKKEFSEKELGIHFLQIALGEEYFYVLGGGYDKIIKLDYEGNIIAKRRVGGYVDALTCYEGNLFFVTGEDEEEILDVPNQFCANKYIAEQDFEQGEIKRCTADEQGICRIGSVTMYDHGSYFSTNPYFPAYKGENEYHADAGEQIDSDLQTQWTKPVEEMLKEKGLAGYSYEVQEYQSGSFLYGTVQVRGSMLWFKDKKLKEGLAYKISLETGELSVLAEKKNIFMIIAADDCVVYQEKGKIMREELSTGKTEQLAEIHNAAQCNVLVSGDYISVYNEDNEEQWIRWLVR